MLLRGSRPHLPAPCGCQNWPETAFWASRGHGKVLLPWMGFLPIWTVGGVQAANQHPFLAQQRADAATHHGARGPEAPPKIT